MVGRLATIMYRLSINSGSLNLQEAIYLSTYLCVIAFIQSTCSLRYYHKIVCKTAVPLVLIPRLDRREKSSEFNPCKRRLQWNVQYTSTFVLIDGWINFICTRNNLQRVAQGCCSGISCLAKSTKSETWSREKMSFVLLFLWAKYIYVIKIRRQLVEVCGDCLMSVQWVRK